MNSATAVSNARLSFASAWFHRIVLAILVSGACALAASTYSVFGHTWDEPEHLAAGLKLLSSGDYPYDVQHPPLARLAMAIGPYLAGARPYGNSGPSGEKEGRDILYRGGHYEQYLALARAGMLPFLALLVIATWLWTRYTFGLPQATLAAFFVVTTPPILGHGAIAALDVPMAAMTMLALYMFVRWHDTPTEGRALAFGVVAGLAVATKLSAIPFLACAILVWVAAWRWRLTGAARHDIAIPRLSVLLIHGVSSTLIALLTLILCYGLSVEPLSPQLPIPVPVGVHRFIASLRALTEHNDSGHLSYFLGEEGRSGWWEFYLVVLGVKTPLPLLLLGLAGAAWTVRRCWRTRNWTMAAPAVAFVGILAFASAYSRINIGVRHIIVLLPLLAVMAAFTTMALWRRMPQWWLRGTLVALLAWQASSVVRAHPDDLAYFNELAGSHPEHIVVDSDLDWGQDLRRLEQVLIRRHIKDVSFVYRGTADLSREPIAAKWHMLAPHEPATGWIAVSLLAKETSGQPNGYDWLDAYQPLIRVGKSFDLYYIRK